MDSYTCRNRALNSYQKWFIGNDIREILLADEDIQRTVGTNIYPLVAPENVEGDFIVYSREKYSKAYVKQGVYEDDCKLAIVVISDNYDSAVTLASLIDNALTGKHVKDDGMVINIDLDDSSETFDDLKYIETLIFKIS